MLIVTREPEDESEEENLGTNLIKFYGQIFILQDIYITVTIFKYKKFAARHKKDIKNKVFIMRILQDGIGKGESYP